MTAHLPAAATVYTTDGPIEASDLGRTLVHEHILVRSPGAQWDPTAGFDRGEVVSRGANALAALAEHGVRTLVDPCPIELGRDPELLAEVAQRSGVRIVCATGFSIENDGWGIPFYWRQRHPEEIAELFIAELRNGIGATGIRPGVIKVATDSPIGFHERKVLRAAGLAAAETGVAVITQTERSAHSEEQQDVLAEAGADLHRCLVGHLDALTSDELATAAGRGAFVGIGRIGSQALATDEHRANLVFQMVARGLESQLCLSQDRACTSPPDWEHPRDLRGATHGSRNRRATASADSADLCNLFTDFVPMLRQRGVDDDHIDAILVRNPRRLLTGT